MSTTCTEGDHATHNWGSVEPAIVRGQPVEMCCCADCPAKLIVGDYDRAFYPHGINAQANPPRFRQPLRRIRALRLNLRQR